MMSGDMELRARLVEGFSVYIRGQASSAAVLLVDDYPLEDLTGNWFGGVAPAFGRPWRAPSVVPVSRPRDSRPAPARRRTSVPPAPPACLDPICSPIGRVGMHHHGGIHTSEGPIVVAP